MRALVALLVLTGLSASLAAASPSAARISLVVRPNPVAAGAAVVITGSAGLCPAGDTVTVLSRAFAPTYEFAGVPAVTASVRRGGFFATEARIPPARHPATYNVTARCGGGNLGRIVHLRVTPAIALRVTPNPVKAGHLATITGSAGDCPPGQTVTVISSAFSAVHEFAGVPAVSTTVRKGGAFWKSTTIPASRRAGAYSVTARCGGGNLGVAVDLRVVRPRHS